MQPVAAVLSGEEEVCFRAIYVCTQRNCLLDFLHRMYVCIVYFYRCCREDKSKLMVYVWGGGL